MKKIVFILICLFVYSISTQAQVSIAITKEERALGEKRSKELLRIYKKNKATECKISFEFDVVIESNHKASKTKTLSYEVFFDELY